ncbi:MAG: hypothetical protein U0176_22590 [Bacteroidia bacterium]
MKLPSPPLLRRWLLVVVLVACGQCLPLKVSAQAGFIPDSVELTDLRFFRSKDAGRLYSQYRLTTESDRALGMKLLQSALEAARGVHDLPAEGLLHGELSKVYRTMQQPGLATDHVNRALALDPAMPPLSPLRQRMHRDLAGFYGDFGAYHLSLHHLVLALAIDQQRDPTPTARMFRHCSGVAIGYQRVGKADSALYYHDRCVQIASKLPDPMWVSSALNNMGMVLQDNHHNDSALTVFRNALGMLDPGNPVQREFATHVRDNLGDALLRSGQLEEALEVFGQNQSELSDPTKGDHIKVGLRMVHCLLALRMADQAANLLSTLHSDLRHLRPNDQTNSKASILRAEIAVASAQLHWQEAYLKQQHLTAMQDSINQGASKVNIATLEGLFLDKTAQYQRELGLIQKNAEASTAKSKFQTLLALSGGLLLGLLLLTLLISYRRRAERNRARHENETYQRELAEMSLKNERLEKAQLVQELEMRQRDITDYALVYSQRKKIFEEVLESLKQIKRSPNPERSLQELMIGLKGKMDGEGLLHLEEEHIEQVNHAFFDKLRQRFPNLGSGELELCGMIRLGYTAKDIAAIRNIAPASVRIAKTRLKKKMGLGPEEDLLEYLGRD